MNFEVLDKGFFEVFGPVGIYEFFYRVSTLINNFFKNSSFFTKASIALVFFVFFFFNYITYLDISIFLIMTGVFYYIFEYESYFFYF